MIRRLCRINGRIADFFGMVGAVLISVLALLLGFDVVMRFVFNNPVSWVLDITGLVQATIAFVAASYILKIGGHVSMNILTDYVGNAWRRRFAILSNFIATVICGWMSYLSWGLFAKSYRIREATYGLDLPLYPWKILVSFCFLMMAVQSLAMCIESFYAPPEQFSTEKGRE